jgi:hypothetical protein
MRIAQASGLQHACHEGAPLGRRGAFAVAHGWEGDHAASMGEMSAL